MFLKEKNVFFQQKLDSLTLGTKLAKSGSNKEKFNSANFILMSIGKSGIIKFEF